MAKRRKAAKLYVIDPKRSFGAVRYRKLPNVRFGAGCLVASQSPIHHACVIRQRHQAQCLTVSLNVGNITGALWCELSGVPIELSAESLRLTRSQQDPVGESRQVIRR
jgi:hypothetical protein